jgi:hypothetical protein
MSRALFLGTLLLVGPFSMAWAQNKTVPTETGPPVPAWSFSDVAAGLALPQWTVDESAPGGTPWRCRG